jgi:amino acid efflux transporter
VAGVAAVVLTLGTTNAYISGAIQMVGELRTGAGRPAGFLAVIGVTGAAGLALYGLGLVNVAAMVELPTALFLAVYLGAMAAAVRLLRGKVRIAAIPAGLAVAAMLSFCGWAVALPVAVALTVLAARRGLRSAPVRLPRLRPEHCA